MPTIVMQSPCAKTQDWLKAACCNVSFSPAGGALLLLPADSEPEADHEKFCVLQTLRRKSSLAEQTIAQSRPTCLSTHSHLTELSQQPGFPLQSSSTRQALHALIIRRVIYICLRWRRYMAGCCQGDVRYANIYRYYKWLGCLCKVFLLFINNSNID